jgi:hypothetical protein
MHRNALLRQRREGIAERGLGRIGDGADGRAEQEDFQFDAALGAGAGAPRHP